MLLSQRVSYFLKPSLQVGGDIHSLQLTTWAFIVVLCCVYSVCVDIAFILHVDRLVDVPVGVTQEEGHTGFFNLPPAVHALIFLARRIQPFLSLVDREVEFGFIIHEIIVLHLLGSDWAVYFTTIMGIGWE